MAGVVDKRRPSLDKARDADKAGWLATMSRAGYPCGTGVLDKQRPLA